MAQFSTGFGPQEEFELPGPDRRGHGESDEKPPIVARNIKLLGQGTKVATANLWVRKWRWTWHGALLHRRGDSQWVQLDNRAWLDGHRNLRFAPLGDDFFERYGILDRDGHSLSDKDLPILGLSAKTRGEIAHGADRGIAGAFRKADLTERRVTLGDPSTKPEQSATSAPAGDQCARRFAHRHRHLDRALGRVRDRHGVIEEHHDAVAGELIERPLVLADERPERSVVLAQAIEDLLRLGSLREGGVAAQVAEHDDNLAAMAFEDFFITVRDDQFGELGREKPLQPPDPAQLFDLFGDACLKSPVEFCDLLGALAQFAEQPRVLHRNDRLRRKILQQRNLLVGEGTNFLPNGDNLP